MDDFKTISVKLFPYAYNIVGDTAESEDIIQDVLFRYSQKDIDSIANRDAYLIKAVINQSINVKKKNEKLRKLRITLPEPIVTNRGESKMEKEEILDYSMLVLLDTLNIKERAVFLLKEAFNYDHTEVAKTLTITIENSRQILNRAKKKLKARKPKHETSSSEKEEYLKNYVDAIRSGDVQLLEQMLAEEVQVLADGGAKLNVVAELTHGIRDTIKMVTYIYELYQTDFRTEIAEINHQTALLFYKKSELVNCQVFAFNNEGKISSIYSVVDPDKLQGI